MRTIGVLITILLFSSVAYCQPIKGIQKKEAILEARKWAETCRPPMDSSYTNVTAVFLSKENSWIINFSKSSSTHLLESDYMLRVQATSGKSPQLIRSSKKRRYAPYFKSDQ